MAGTAAPGGRVEPSAAWDLAREAAAAAAIELCPLVTLEDADAVLEVMVATWGEHQLLPREVIRALADSGNVPYGAVAEGKLVGYVLGWVGVEEGEPPHVHSHMLAVRPGIRSRGVGVALKLAQRAQALGAGIHTVRWTFDPLLAGNAHFNFERLGVVADRFLANCYGEMTDIINRGDRSDRFLVRWDLDRDPGPRPAPGSSEPLLLAVGEPEAPRPHRAGDPAPGTAWRVEIPRDLLELRSGDPALARAWRDASADAFQACLGMGLQAVAFRRDPDGGAPAYYFGAPEAA